MYMKVENLIKRPLPKIQNCFLKMIETEMNIIKETKRRSKGIYILLNKKKGNRIRDTTFSLGKADATQSVK